MKRLILLVFPALVFINQSAGQTPKSSKPASKPSTTKKVTATGKKRSNSNQAGTVNLTSTGNYSAAAPSAPASLSISDPVILDLKDRAMGNFPAINSSPIPGMPKRTYGFANGHIFLRSTDAPGIGSTTGSGSVGTGTTMGSVGTSGHAPGVNGKSPLAGGSIYGIPGFEPKKSYALPDQANKPKN